MATIRTAIENRSDSPAAGRSSRFLSFPYLVLRSTTAAGGLLGGLIQTFVFARILEPERFSIFILVAALGVALWLCDLGMGKLVFVRLRAWFLGEAAKDAGIRRHATAIVILYSLLSLVGSAICFVVALTWFHTSLVGGLEIALFFLFTALTLVWFAIRHISVAIDDFIFFESLEAVRRLSHMAVLLATLVGLSLMSFLVIANLIWAALFFISLSRLSRRGAIELSLRDFRTNLMDFFASNRKEIAQTGIYSGNEFYIYNFPYVIVPAVFGLGAPTIILDTVFKFFRGAAVLYAAGCDIAVPRQTRAFNEGDRRSLILATLMAAALCSLPCAALVLLLLFGADMFFPLLLGNSATIPPEVTPVLIVLLVAGLVGTVANFVLIYTGFFKQMASFSLLESAAMTVVTVIAVLAQVELVGFLKAYAAVYVASALSYLSLALRGPLRRS